MKHKPLTLGLALLVLLLIALALIFRHWDSGSVANIYQNGLLIRSIDLSQVDAPYSFTVTDSQGHKNTIEVESGRIRVSEASCPDQICVNAGWLDSGIAPIVCLPARLVIRLEKSGGTLYDSSAQIDGVAG